MDEVSRTLKNLSNDISRRQVIKVVGGVASIAAFGPIVSGWGPGLARAGSTPTSEPPGTIPPSGGATTEISLPDYAPVPPSALGPALNDQGYYVGRVERNLYWVTDGTYQSAFLTTSDGVVLLDAPPTIGHNIQRAVDEIAAANGVSNKVTHLIYSHHHADHTGASFLFDNDVVRIGHDETRRLLLRDNDPARPAPEETFQDRRSLEIGGERIDLAWYGSNHSPDNIYIHLPDHDTLMLVDIVNAGWVARLPLQPHRGHPRLHRGAGQRPRLPMEALHRRPPRQARHPRRRHPAPAVHGRHRRQRQTGARHRRPHALLRELRRELVGRGEGLPRRRHRRRRHTRHRQVHRRPRGGRRVHRQHHVLGHGVDPPRPRLRLPSSPMNDYQSSEVAAVRSMDPGVTGLVAGVATLVVYELSRHRSDVALDEARTSATLALLGLALVVLVLASRPLAPWKAMLAGAMAAGGAVIVGIRAVTDRLWRTGRDRNPVVTTEG